MFAVLPLSTIIDKANTLHKVGYQIAGVYVHSLNLKNALFNSNAGHPKNVSTIKL